MESNEKKLPGIGMRIVKSAVAVALCYAANLLRGTNGIVFHSQISALWCIQSYNSTTKQNALQRLIGTVFGAAIGLLIMLVERFIHSYFNLSDTGFYLVCGAITSASIIVVLYLTIVLKYKQSSYIACVVFLSIVVPHLTDESIYLFALNRFLDTSIGIVIGVVVNLFQLPHKRRKDILFISGLDNTLLTHEYHLNDYCKIELNRMIDEGLNFTLATLRTPASILEPMKDIKFKLPLIAMDGAVLYDANEKKYLSKITMSVEEKNEIQNFINKYDLDCLTNIVVDDTLLIYYNEPKEDAVKNVIEKLRKSPYRNFIKRPAPADEEVVYFMILCNDNQAENLYADFEANKFTERFKILKYKSRDIPGFSYIKIYNKHASRRNMIEYLKRHLGIDKTVFIGTVPEKYDYVVEEGNSNQVVRTLKKLYEH